jgi:type VI secretion system protein ImpA
MMVESDSLLYEHNQDILAPISKENPSGVDLRNAAGFDWLGLKEARKGDGSGRLCLEDAPIRKPNWLRVRELAEEALTRHTKDLQIAIWLTQALTLTAGFDGLDEGLFMVRELIRCYWGMGLHPHDDEDYEGDGRGELLKWLRHEMPIWIAAVPLTPEVNCVCYSLSDYTALTKKREQANDDLKTPAHDREFLLLQIRHSLQRAGEEFVEGSLDRIGRVRRQVQRLMECLAEVGQAITFDDAFESLDECTSLLERWAYRLEVRTEDVERAEPEVVAPASNTDSWERALMLIRRGDFEPAADPVQSTLSGAHSERERFLRKVEFASTLFEVRQYELAIDTLQPLCEQIERFQLQEWEAPDVSGRVWQLLYDCYRRSGQHSVDVRDLESKLRRTAPWISLRALADSHTADLK